MRHARSAVLAALDRLAQSIDGNEKIRVGGENTFGFQIRNVRLTFSGNLATKNLTYKLQMDLAKFKDELLLDAWMQYRFNPNVEIRVGDGSRGWAEHAPFDRILVAAAADGVPPALVEQLRPGGRMVLPLGG